MLRAILVFATALGCFSLVTFAKPADKKTETSKAKDDIGKSKDPGNTKTREKTPSDKLKLPKNGVPSVEDLLEAQTAKQIQDLLAQIEALKSQLKPHRTVPSWCRLHGRLDGDFLAFRVEFDFETKNPRTLVPLGLQGGFLTPEGDLGGQTPILIDDKDEGLLLRVDKDGVYKAILNFRVPIKKSFTNPSEREIELGLPGAVGTTLSLELGATVMELRSNGTLEKAETPGRWKEIALGKIKKLKLEWKEPMSFSVGAPMIKVEGAINVTVDEKDVHITADLSLEDSQRQTKDWRLLLPPTAEVEITKKPVGLSADWIKPDAKTPYHIVRASAATADAWKVTVTLHMRRPSPGAPALAIGPFHVLDAALHKGTITVKMPADFSFGQRLKYLRSENTYQKSADKDSIFTYVAPRVSKENANAMKTLAPLKLEWQKQKNQVESQAAHELKLLPAGLAWEIETTTRIQVKALFSTLDAVDLKLPQTRSDDFAVVDELGTPLRLVVPEGTGKTHVLLERSVPPKQVTLVLKNKIRVPAGTQRIRLELPQPLDTQERPAKLSIDAGKQIELLDGPAGNERPVPDRHYFSRTWNKSPEVVEFAWRPFHREVVAHVTFDITLYANTAHVKQTLRLPKDETTPDADSKKNQVALNVPAGVGKVMHGKVVHHVPDKQVLWVSTGPDGDADIVLHYDLAISKKTGNLDVIPIWPANISHKDVKVRVWSAGNVKARLTDELVDKGVWKERSIEVVPGRDELPAFVMHGFGANLALSFKVEETVGPRLAAFVADRALVQVHMLEDGSQQCRARYVISKIQTPFVDIELPIALARFREKPSFTIGKKAVHGEAVLNAENVVRMNLHPELLTKSSTLLEITYTIPADALEGASVWRTTLHAPTFQSEVVIRKMHWHLTTAAPMIGASLSRHAVADTHWGWQGWLWTPEAAPANADLEAWPDLAQESAGVTFSFALIGTRPEIVYHLPRAWWLLGCSGVFLIVTLGGYFSPWSRRTVGLVLLALAVAALTFGILLPAAVAPLVFGSQPGVVLCLVFVGIHWLLQERYRRQLVFLPGFTRAKPGSTVVHTKAAPRPREASTVDAPTAGVPEDTAASQTKGSSS